MNKKTVSIAILLAGLVGMLTFACEEKNSVSSGDRVQNPGEDTPEAVVGLEMYGMLERSDSGELVLVDGQDRYDLKCDSDVTDLIGRQVKVIGTLKTDGSDRFIQIVQAIENPGNLTE
ncbi:hypothetical protein [Desulfospira joergensenii]|uniref:hypothetical protein n=1 Tax=Desulfospira joergensenii TaxID=53329 RepID=UPI0003B4917E|nr:hypothetical protein [Desulfospira joergensenii]